jgi:hypothetical protein
MFSKINYILIYFYGSILLSSVKVPMPAGSCPEVDYNDDDDDDVGCITQKS